LNVEHRTLNEKRNVELFLLLFLLIALISTLTSIYKRESIETFANLLTHASVFFLIIRNIRTDKPAQPINQQTNQPTNRSADSTDQPIFRLTLFLIFAIIILAKGLSCIRSELTFNDPTDKPTQPTNWPTIFDIWTGILAALLHSRWQLICCLSKRFAFLRFTRVINSLESHKSIEKQDKPK